MSKSSVQIGDVIAGKYRVERILGIGGMGVVAAARHVDLDELRAVKFMRSKAKASATAAERFMREAKAIVRLKSEHVVQLHDVGHLEGGEPYMVMEYLEGEDLKELVDRQGPLAIEDAVHYVMQACAGLAEAHEAGIVHRDLKPSNLFLTTTSDGMPCVKVLDFGISKLVGPEKADDLTATAAMLGSPYYMSPEQMRSTRNVDARADIWAVGVMLYELLLGVKPFSGDTVTAVAAEVVQEDPVPPCSLRPDVPEGLEKVILRCLEKRSDDRYPTVAALADELAPFGVAADQQLLERIERIQHVTERGSLSTSNERVVSGDATTVASDSNATPTTAKPAVLAASAPGDGPSGSTAPGWERTDSQEAKQSKQSSQAVRALAAVVVLAAVAGVALLLRSMTAESSPATHTTQTASTSVVQSAAKSPTAGAARPAPAPTSSSSPTASAAAGPHSASASAASAARTTASAATPTTKRVAPTVKTAPPTTKTPKSNTKPKSVWDER